MAFASKAVYCCVVLSGALRTVCGLAQRVPGMFNSPLITQLFDHGQVT
jgi:hypothetical protein